MWKVLREKRRTARSVASALLKVVCAIMLVAAHSAENVHLASGYRHVVVLAPLARRPGSEGHATMFEGLRREPSWGTELFSCIEDLEAGGSSVLLLTPSPAVLEAMGGNNMNPAARAATAQAGFRQGVESARSLGQFLES